MTKSAYSISEFCLDHGISRGTYYNLKRRGRGPREMHLGGQTVRITEEAAAEWRRQMEEASAPERDRQTEAA